MHVLFGSNEKPFLQKHRGSPVSLVVHPSAWEQVKLSHAPPVASKMKEKTKNADSHELY